MKLNLLLILLSFCLLTKAQSNIDLKDFINKNHTAISSVQKIILTTNNHNDTLNFKDLLKKQKSSVKLYNSNKDVSFYYAYSVRKECVEFLKRYNNKSVNFYEITENEKLFLKPTKKNINTILSETEIQEINNLDILNPQILRNNSLTIQ